MSAINIGDMTGKYKAYQYRPLSFESDGWHCCSLLLVFFFLELTVVSPSLLQTGQLHRGIAEVARK
jgi:hypothetical protein|tara:strand:+ start:684 stop:881 length:198 start_codon:yes stop_codon:yes gene_type:complete